jgi:hypothetical protein
LWFTWAIRGAVFVVFGLLLLIGALVFANWQVYVLVGIGSLLMGAFWLHSAYKDAAFDRERARGGASSEAAEQGLHSAKWQSLPSDPAKRSA